MKHSRWSSVALLLPIAGLAACGGGSATAQKSSPPATAPATKASPAAAAHPAAPPAAGAPATITGAVAETMNSGGYTYVRLKTDSGDTWIAASEFAVKAGERLTVAPDMPMENFHSKTLNRDFPMIYFVSQVAREGEPLQQVAREADPPSPHGPGGAPMTMSPSHGSTPTAGPVGKIEPATGGMSIADVWAKRKDLAGKTVTVRGKVVKFNGGIMNRNWLHLQDGSGSASDGTNDLTVTTDADVKVGDVVTASGMLATAKDFGAGYAYDAIIESATIRK